MREGKSSAPRRPPRKEIRLDIEGRAGLKKPKRQSGYKEGWNE